MFWNRSFVKGPDPDKKNGISVGGKIAGIVVVEANDAVEAYRKIEEIEKEWKDGSYCVDSVRGPFSTKEDATRN